MTRPVYYAVLADIHANFVALRAVARAARTLAAEDGATLRFLCLGDVVDYGPQPNECVAWVRRHAAVTVRGNHEDLCLSDAPPLESDPQLWPITLWTRAHLTDETRALITTWPQTAIVNALLLFHSSLVRPNSYVRSAAAARAEFVKLPEGTRYGLFGHTHVPTLFVAEPLTPAMLLVAADTPASAIPTMPPGIWYDLSRLGALINPGSVGQPRRHSALVAAGAPHDGRASYALLREPKTDHWQVRFELVAYDNAQVARRLRALAQDARKNGIAHRSPAPAAFAEAFDDAASQLPNLVEYLIAQLVG
jgi:predicted phosphodiesterase